MCAHLCVCECACVCACMRVCMCVRMYVCVCVCDVLVCMYPCVFVTLCALGSHQSSRSSEYDSSIVTGCSSSSHGMHIIHLDT